MAAEKYALTPRDVANRFGIGVHKVLFWIARGELVAINVASDIGKRPQWRILPDALAEFVRRRAAKPPAKNHRRRNSKDSNGVIEFF